MGESGGRELFLDIKVKVLNNRCSVSVYKNSKLYDLVKEKLPGGDVEYDAIFDIESPFNSIFSQISKFDSPISNLGEFCSYVEEITGGKLKFDNFNFSKLRDIVLEICLIPRINSPIVIQIDDSSTKIPWEAMFLNDSGEINEGILVFRGASRRHTHSCDNPKDAHTFIGYFPHDIGIDVNQIQKLAEWAAGSNINDLEMPCFEPSRQNIRESSFSSIGMKPAWPRLVDQKSSERISLLYAPIAKNKHIQIHEHDHPYHKGFIAASITHSLVFGVFPIGWKGAPEWSEGVRWVTSCVEIGAMLGISTYECHDPTSAATYARCVTNGIFLGLKDCKTNLGLAQRIRYCAKETGRLRNDSSWAANLLIAIATESLIEPEGSSHTLPNNEGENKMPSRNWIKAFGEGTVHASGKLGAPLKVLLAKMDADDRDKMNSKINSTLEQIALGQIEYSDDIMIGLVKLNEEMGDLKIFILKLLGTNVSFIVNEITETPTEIHRHLSGWDFIGLTPITEKELKERLLNLYSTKMELFWHDLDGIAGGIDITRLNQSRRPVVAIRDFISNCRGKSAISLLNTFSALYRDNDGEEVLEKLVKHLAEHVELEEKYCVC